MLDRQAILAYQETKDCPAQLGYQAVLDCLGQPDLLGSKEQLVPQEPLVQRDPLGYQVPQVTTDSLALRVQLAPQDNKDHVEIPVQLDRLVTKEVPVQLEIQVSLGRQGL